MSWYIDVDKGLTNTEFPDVAEGTITAPGPTATWYVNNDNELVTGLMISVYPNIMEPPYPISMWYVDIDEGHPTLDAFPDIPVLMEAPYPEAMWYVDTDAGHPTLGAFPEMPDFGAISHASNLKTIKISSTVNSIGEDSFRNTALTSVQLPSGCTYSSTSFPDNCTIIIQ